MVDRPWGVIRPALLAIFVSVLGCATYQHEVDDFRSVLANREAAKAASLMQEKALADSKDQVVYLMEYATALQVAEDYKRSNEYFLKADDLTEIKDYHSLTRVTESMLGSASMIQYKGEDYEKVLINAMMAINFLMLRDYDNANAMTRRLNDKLYKYKYEAKRDYEQNPFAYYLSALVWETNKDYDNAYINLKKAYELEPTVPYFKEDLIRLAHKARRQEDLESWKRKFPGVQGADLKANGELILIYQQGWAPVKRPHPSFPRIPKLYRVPSVTETARLEVEQGPSEATQTIYSIQDVAIKNLDDQYAGMVASRMAGLASKAVVADQIRQKNELLGELAWIGMNIADRPDLRQWLSLPATFQVAKLRLRPGKYRVRVVGLTATGAASGEQSEWGEATVVPGKKTFMNWRSFR